jgi:hypothetical protein
VAVEVWRCTPPPYDDDDRALLVCTVSGRALSNVPMFADVDEAERFLDHCTAQGKDPRIMTESEITRALIDYRSDA